MVNRKIDIKFKSHHSIKWNINNREMQCKIKWTAIHKHHTWFWHIMARIMAYLEEMQAQVQPITMIIYINGSALDYSSSSASVMSYCCLALIHPHLVDQTWNLTHVLKLTLAQFMAWCHQATRHNLSQCWPRPLSPYGVTRPQWVD